MLCCGVCWQGKMLLLTLKTLVTAKTQENLWRTEGVLHWWDRFVYSSNKDIRRTCASHLKPRQDTRIRYQDSAVPCSNLDSSSCCPWIYQERVEVKALLWFFYFLYLSHLSVFAKLNITVVVVLDFLCYNLI